jgi:nucleoside-diphosphate-sugar epimerase
MIFITGATGRLGKEVLAEIPEAIPLVRKKSGLAREIVTGFSEAQLKRILKKADVVIHLAGSLDFGNKKALWQTNVELTGRIVDAMPEKARMVYASSTAVYGKKLAKLPADEETPCYPDNEYAKTKYEAEGAVMHHENSIILRMPPIYGKDFEDYYAFIGRIRHGKAVIIGAGSNRVAFVHVSDAAKAIRNALRAKPDIYLLSGNSLTQKEVYEIAARQLKVSPPRKHISRHIALLLAGISKVKAHITGKRPRLTKEQVDALASDRVFDCKKAKKELKFRPRNLEQGIKEMVGYYLESVKLHGKDI